MAITIKDVAKKAGVSISTVSKVIHDAPTISESTKQKIRSIMKELNYYPNIIAQSFASQSSYHIGLIMTLKKEDAFLNPYIYEILAGIEETAKKHGYLLSLINMNTVSEDPHELEKLIMQKRVDGLIIHLAGFKNKLLKILDKKKFPYIFIGQPSFTSSSCWVDINNTKAGEIATEHLINQGCEKIAYLGDGINNFICKSRYNGYQNALELKGYEINSEYIKDTSDISEQTSVLIDKLMGLKKQPDGLVCSNNFIAFESLKSLQQKGISIPNDIRIITFDNYPFAPFTTPKLSVVDIDVFELGVQAANILIKKLLNPTITIQYSLLSPSLIIRESSQ